MSLHKALSVVYRYLITNYELSSFSVYQARFEDGLSEQIVAIPPANATNSSANATSEARHSTRISRGAVVGASVGSITSFLFLIFILIFTTWKWRSKAPRQNETNNTGPLEPRHDGDNCNTIYEMHNNSQYWGYREMADSGKAELLDENRPSGSGKTIQEMPPHSPAELMTSQYSPESSMAQSPKAPNKVATFVSEGRSRELNRTSFDESEDFPRIEPLVSSSFRQPSFPRDLSSRHTSLYPDRPSSCPR